MLTLDKIPTAKWGDIAALVNRIIEAREMTFTAFVEESGFPLRNLTRVHAWIRRGVEPRRESGNRIIAWAQENYSALSIETIKATKSKAMHPLTKAEVQSNRDRILANAGSKKK